MVWVGENDNIPTAIHTSLALPLNVVAMFQMQECKKEKRTASDELAPGQLGSEPSPVTSPSHRNAQ